MDENETQSSQPAGGGDRSIADGTAGATPNPTPTGEPATPEGGLSTDPRSELHEVIRHATRLRLDANAQRRPHWFVMCRHDLYSLLLRAAGALRLRDEQGLDPLELISQAADVANIAMMIADTYSRDTSGHTAHRILFGDRATGAAPDPANDTGRLRELLENLTDTMLSSTSFEDGIDSDIWAVFVAARQYLDPSLRIVRCPECGWEQLATPDVTDFGCSECTCAFEDPDPDALGPDDLS